MRRLLRFTSVVFCTVLAGSLFFAAAPAEASPIYEFTLPANGPFVGAVTITLNEGAFVPVAGLITGPLTSPGITFTSTNSLNAANSFIGIQQQGAYLLFGVNLVDTSGNVVLYTVNYPGDFFLFPVLPGQFGSYSSTAGNMDSDFALGTPNPTMSLLITDTPEPASIVLLATGLLALGLAGWSRGRMAATA